MSPWHGIHPKVEYYTRRWSKPLIRFGALGGSVSLIGPAYSPPWKVCLTFGPRSQVFGWVLIFNENVAEFHGVSDLPSFLTDDELKRIA